MSINNEMIHGLILKQLFLDYDVLRDLLDNIYFFTPSIDSQISTFSAAAPRILPSFIL